MQDVVMVSSVDKLDQLKSFIENKFAKKRYAEITQAIGIYSVLIDSEHTISDQARLYRTVLGLVKDRIKANIGKGYAAWYAQFPQRAANAAIHAGMAAATVNAIASRISAYGSFKSVDDFFFWALDDRRLTLEQLVMVIENTAVAS